MFLFVTRVIGSIAKLFKIPLALHTHEVAYLIGKDTRTVQKQCVFDLEAGDGKNIDNFNAFKCGTDIVIPAKPFWIKLMVGYGLGPEFYTDDRFADFMISKGLAVEVKDDQV